MTKTPEDKITMNLKLLTLAIASIISVFGFFIQRTLDSIDRNLTELRVEMQKKSELLNNHETRIQLLERIKEKQP